MAITHKIIKKLSPTNPKDAVNCGRPFIITLWIPKKIIKENIKVRIKFLVLNFPIEKYITSPINGIVNRLSKCKPVANPMI